MQTITPKQLTADPVIDWLESIRDYLETAGDPSREMAQRVIDRLSGADSLTPRELIDELIDSLGTWRVGHSAVISDRPQPGSHLGDSADDISYYGGYVIGETMGRTTRILVSHLPQLLAAARTSEPGRKELEAIARELQAAAPKRPKVHCRLDAASELTALADELGYADLYGAAEVLRALAVAVMRNKVPEVSAWLRTELGLRVRT